MKDIQAQMQRDGYVVLEDFLRPEEVDELKSCGEEFTINLPQEQQRKVFNTVDPQQNKDQYFLDSANKISFFFEADALEDDGKLKVHPRVSLNKVGHALHWMHPTFRRVTFDERIKEAAFQLNLQEPAVCQSMYIYKNPGLGSEEFNAEAWDTNDGYLKGINVVNKLQVMNGVAERAVQLIQYYINISTTKEERKQYLVQVLIIAHQDAAYLYTDPVKVVGFWIALDDATLENGCLWIAPGSHKSGVHRRYIRNKDASSSELVTYDRPAPCYPASNFRAVPVRRGTCILIDGQVVHFSRANKSDKSRHAYTFHVIETKHVAYSKDNWLQPPTGGFPLLYRH